MIVIMLRAFLRAFFADPDAHSRQLSRLLTAEAHQLRHSRADGRAFEIGLYALRHVSGLFCPEVHACAMVADRSALKAGINATFIAVVVHRNVFESAHKKHTLLFQ